MRASATDHELKRCPKRPNGVGFTNPNSFIRLNPRYPWSQLRSGTRTPSKGPEANFTGNVSVEPLFPVNAPSRTSGASVTFEPGARSAWHTHPLGQVLIVTAGKGWVQQEGGEKQEIKPGDVVWTPPGMKHWHGATPTTAMTHIAIQEALDVKVVEWMEKVTDEQYKD